MFLAVDFKFDNLMLFEEKQDVFIPLNTVYITSRKLFRLRYVVPVKKAHFQGSYVFRNLLMKLVSTGIDFK